MVRPLKDAAERKVKITTRLDPILHAWLMSQVGPGQRWADITHALEYAVAVLREEEELGSVVKLPRARPLPVARPLRDGRPLRDEEGSPSRGSGSSKAAKK